MTKLLMGVDFGTGGCKTTVIDIEGNIRAAAFQEYPCEHKYSGWSEQDPQLWINAFINTVNHCREQLNNDFSGLISMAFSASTHNAVLLDKDDHVIRHCIMWNDQRSGDQCVRLKEKYADKIFKIGMQLPTPTWTLPQLMWVMENEPENYKKISKILFTKDYVRSFVTGDFCTDPVDAQGSLLFDANKNEWSKEICDMISLPIDVLPAIKGSKEIVGFVSKRVSELTGLPEGLPVITGCSDTAAEDLSAGAVKDGQIVVKLATAGNVNIISDISHPHPMTFTYPYSVEGMWYTVTATNSAAASFRWLRDCIYKTEKEVCESAGEDIYVNMDEEAASIEPGAKGLIFHPYLIGERCPYYNSNFRANFFGVSAIHTRPYFTRALLEGVAYSLYDCYKVLSDFNKDAEDIRIIGGGAKSRVWCQIVADVFGLAVKFPENAESSYGGAILAGVGSGVFENEIIAADTCVKIQKTYYPNMENHKLYMKYYSVYRNITSALTPIWNEMNSITQ